MSHKEMAHDELVAALNDSLRMLRAAYMTMGMQFDTNRRVIALQAVLVKAKGEPA